MPLRQPANPPETEARASRTGELLLGGVLALLLLAACLTWEAVFDVAVPEAGAALSVGPEPHSPVRSDD